MFTSHGTASLPTKLKHPHFMKSGRAVLHDSGKTCCELR